MPLDAGMLVETSRDTSDVSHDPTRQVRRRLQVGVIDVAAQRGDRHVQVRLRSWGHR
jgi:hypothetical protein